MTLLARIVGRLFAEATVPRHGQSGDPRARWTPTHRHRKGGEYRVLGHGLLETDRSDVVIYDDADGTIWVRPVAEFYDGRFEALAQDQAWRLSARAR